MNIHCCPKEINFTICKFQIFTEETLKEKIIELKIKDTLVRTGV
jgi:hypothetical protein